ncbi:hypothetical protein DFH27DRAFT_316761 [Peziza echinospora]|nr:hypothetical protein DFH27DRAFT_316761 [Peziza echinospora]
MRGRQRESQTHGCALRRCFLNTTRTPRIPQDARTHARTHRGACLRRTRRGLLRRLLAGEGGRRARKSLPAAPLPGPAPNPLHSITRAHTRSRSRRCGKVVPGHPPPMSLPVCLPPPLPPPSQSPPNACKSMHTARARSAGAGPSATGVSGATKNVGGECSSEACNILRAREGGERGGVACLEGLGMALVPRPFYTTPCTTGGRVERRTCGALRANVGSEQRNERNALTNKNKTDYILAFPKANVE